VRCWLSVGASVAREAPRLALELARLDPGDIDNARVDPSAIVFKSISGRSWASSTMSACSTSSAWPAFTASRESRRTRRHSDARAGAGHAGNPEATSAYWNISSIR